MDQLTAKKILQELIKRDDLKNKTCIDCGNLNPQWASVSFAIFLCLQCAGLHRGFGVHISFVRSVSMDTWQADQIKRMQLGGNAPFTQFIMSYTPPDQGGYKQGMTAYDTYHCWAASQYRNKLDADIAGKLWSPSAPPSDTSTSANGTNSPGRPSSAQGLRKSRALARNFVTSPVSFAHFPHPPPNLSTIDQKSANEEFLSSLGQANAGRPADLPPSQGGRYQGFGNTSSSPSTSQHPSLTLSSTSAPTFQDLQDNPSVALSKGWSIFSAVVAGASRAVSESVIQPGMERAMDPTLRATVRSYVSEAQRCAQVAGRSANEWSKIQLGVDVADQVGGVVETVKDKFASGSMHNEEETSALYHDDTDDFFREYSDSRSSPNQPSVQLPQGMSKTSISNQTSKDGDWDDWKDF